MIKGIARWAAISAATMVVAAAAWAADASGKWTWTQKRGQNEVTQTLELKQDGNKLTGTVSSGNNKTEIKDGAANGADISFNVERERNGQTFKLAYKGKVDGDTIKGTITFTRDGKDMTREWTATRAK